IPGNRLSNAFIQSVLGHVHEPLGLNAAAADGDSAGVISNVTVVNNSYIQADDIAEINAPVAGQPMDYLVVDGNAEMAGEFAIAQKGAAGAVLFDARGSVLVDFLGGAARLNKIADLVQNHSGHGTGRAHCFQIAFAL